MVLVVIPSQKVMKVATNTMKQSSLIIPMLVLVHILLITVGLKHRVRFNDDYTSETAAKRLTTIDSNFGPIVDDVLVCFNLPDIAKQKWI
jgi:hypothetical protein